MYQVILKSQNLYQYSTKNVENQVEGIVKPDLKSNDFL